MFIEFLPIHSPNLAHELNSLHSTESLSFRYNIINLKNKLISSSFLFIVNLSD